MCYSAFRIPHSAFHKYVVFQKMHMALLGRRAVFVAKPVQEAVRDVARQLAPVAQPVLRGIRAGGRWRDHDFSQHGRIVIAKGQHIRHGSLPQECSVHPPHRGRIHERDHELTRAGEAQGARGVSREASEPGERDRLTPLAVEQAKR